MGGLWHCFTLDNLLVSPSFFFTTPCAKMTAVRQTKYTQHVPGSAAELSSHTPLEAWDYGDFHQWWYPNSWMDYNGKPHYNGWFGGTLTSGNRIFFIGYWMLLELKVPCIANDWTKNKLPEPSQTKVFPWKRHPWRTGKIETCQTGLIYDSARSRSIFSVDTGHAVW